MGVNRIGTKAKLIADSQNFTGDRLSTFELEVPTRDVLKIVSHRMLSVSILPEPPLFIDWVEKHPFAGYIPVDVLRIARDSAPELAPVLLAPYSFTRLVVSATEWASLFGKPGTDPEDPVLTMSALWGRPPRLLREGEWHLPYVNLEDSGHPDYVLPEQRDKLLELSVDRTARTQGAFHELIRKREFSWFEHQAQALDQSTRIGNFVGWRQHRKLFATEWTGRKIEATFQGSSYTPFYARMEAAFRQLLLDAAPSAMTERNLLRQFFPRDAEKLPPLTDDDPTLVL